VTITSCNSLLESAAVAGVATPMAQMPKDDNTPRCLDATGSPPINYVIPRRSPVSGTNAEYLLSIILQFTYDINFNPSWV